MTPDDLISQYVKLRDYKEKLAKEHKETISQYDDALIAIAGALQLHLNDAGVDSMKSEHGTAFKKTSMTVRTVDRDALFQYVISTGKFDYLTSAVSKEAVKEHMELHDDVPPPGVDVKFFTEVQVRRPS